MRLGDDDDIAAAVRPGERPRAVEPQLAHEAPRPHDPAALRDRDQLARSIASTTGPLALTTTTAGFSSDSSS